MWGNGDLTPYFVRSALGASNHAVMMSIIQTGILNGIEPLDISLALSLKPLTSFTELPKIRSPWIEEAETKPRHRNNPVISIVNFLEKLTYYKKIWKIRSPKLRDLVNKLYLSCFPASNFK